MSAQAGAGVLRAPVAVGDIYVPSEYPDGPRYQVLAIWDRFAWVHVTYPRVSSGRQPPEPTTLSLGFFDHCAHVGRVSDRMGAVV